MRGRAVVFGNRELGCACLEEVLDLGVEVPLVVTYPPDPGEAPGFRSFAAVAAARGLKAATPPHPRGRALRERVAALAPDLVLSFYYGHRIPEALLAVPRLGAWNLHGSLLPRWQGRAPLPFVILEGEAETGVTLHAMVREFDAGAVAGQRRIAVDPRETATTLYAKTVAAARALVAETVPALLEGRARPVPMDLSRATTTPPLLPLRDLDLSATVERFDRTVRAFARPYPGARLLFDGGSVVVRAGEPGAAGPGVPVRLADGVYRIMILSAEGGPETPVEDFLRGHPGAAKGLGVRGAAAG